MLHICRPPAARGYSHRALEQRPLKRAEMCSINLATIVYAVLTALLLAAISLIGGGLVLRKNSRRQS